MAKVLVPADTLPVRGATEFVAVMPVPASPSGGHNGIPASRFPLSSRKAAPSSVRIPAPYLPSNHAYQSSPETFLLHLRYRLPCFRSVSSEYIHSEWKHNPVLSHVLPDPESSDKDVLCSLSALLDDTETLDTFFEKVHDGQTNAVNRWHQYLSHLARSINLLHLIYDKDFILGGYLAPYLQEKDLSYIHEEIRRMTPFPESQDFLHISKMPKHNITIGAALPYIKEFLGIK